jgi:RNA polymerase sigma-70 factor (ECF subfamily)
MTDTLAEMALPDTGPGTTAPDPHSQRWLDGLRSDGARHDQCARELHAVLLRAARREIHRRRGWLGGATGPELDDLAHQTAGDALVAIIDNLDSYRGASRFTTWAYRFVMNQASIKTRRHLWSGRRVEFDDVDWARLPNPLGTSPHRHSEQHAQLEALREAVEHTLSHRQREVFVAVALNDVPIDVVALRLDSNRGAVYKTLFDARTKLRASLAAAGYPLTEQRKTL